MKKGKHSKNGAEPEKVRKKKRTNEEPLLKIEYEDESGEDAAKKFKIPKAVYRIVIVLLLVIFGLIIWFNRSNLTPDNIGSWLKVKLMGTGIGDGYPAELKGNSVEPANFKSVDGNVLILSDTALTSLNSSAKEIYSVRHSFNNPAMRVRDNNAILYNVGGTKYMLQTGADTALTAETKLDITAADVAQNGEFALGLQGTNSASKLEVYMKDGTLKYEYVFSSGYISAVAINNKGSMGAVCTLDSSKGELVSKITILDFNAETAVKEYEEKGNMLVDIYWGGGGRIFAVGDTALVSTMSPEYAFVSQSYDGKYLTAYELQNNQAVLSISGFEYAGACTLLLYKNSGEPLQVETDERITSISSVGGTVSILAGNEVFFIDSSTGEEYAKQPAGGDLKAVALANERMAYGLGTSEIRSVSAE